MRPQRRLQENFLEEVLSSRDQKAEKSAKRRDQERLFEAEELDVQRLRGGRAGHMRGAVAFWGSQCKWGWHVGSEIRSECGG